MRKRIIQIAAVAVLGLFLAGCLCIAAINTGICAAGSRRILLEEDAARVADVDCILVLGCQVHDDGTPSHMLEDRLKQGVALYALEAAPKLLMSGDHGQEGYNEVGAMKQYAMDSGVPSEDIFMDHAGFSTYESLYRAKVVFGVDKILIVTQKYHLYRALHIADALGMEAYGVAADYRAYYGQWTREIREVLARVKDFGTGIFKPKPALLGDPIPITGNGNITND